MQVEITDVFTDHLQTFAGSPIEVEEALRASYGPILDHVPHGDLQALLDALNRMHGQSVVLVDSVNFQPPKRRFVDRPSLVDAWIRQESPTGAERT